MTLWEIIFVLVILKIPVAYVGWVIWWAVKAVPEVGTQGGTEGINWKPVEASLRPAPPAWGTARAAGTSFRPGRAQA